MFAVLALAVTACAADPPLVSNRVFESPCAAATDCTSGLCLQLPDFSICTMACSGTFCPNGYICEQGVCAPDASAACRTADQVCGAGYSACCTGLYCASFPGVPSTCTHSCTDGHQCSTGCCASAGTGLSVCAPPSYCP
jgi:hypothetical protein